MGPKLKKYLGWFLVIFAVYAIFKSPEQAAQLVSGALDGILAVFSAVGRFFDAVLAGV